MLHGCPCVDCCFLSSGMLSNHLCILCGAPAEAAVERLCPSCYGELPLPAAHVCAGCGAPLPAERDCTRCFPQAPAFDDCLAGCRYRYPVDQMIKKLKYQARLDLVQALSRPLLESIRRDLAVVPDCLLPTPLHRARLRQRGFNQAREIARVLAPRLSLPVEDQLVRRHRSTTQQYELRPAQRKKKC